MGYFSQKKKHQRENSFLTVSAVLAGALSFWLILPDSWTGSVSWIDSYLFQFYALAVLVFFYALWLGRWSFAAFFAFCLLIIFTCLSSYANIFINTRVNDRHHMQLVYRPGEEALEVSGRGMVLLRSGHLNLGEGVRAPFATYEKELQVYTLIGVDFAGLSQKHLQEAFERLRMFIALQDDPVIVYGNFGVPAWSPLLKKLLLATDLKVKNRLVLADAGFRFNPLTVPQFYLLAFENVGLNALRTETGSDGKAGRAVKAELGFY